MAGYASEANAGFRITKLIALGNTFDGMVRLLLEKVVQREPLMADAHNSPVSRPVDELDARATVDALSQGAGVMETTAAGNLVETFTEAGGGTGGITMGRGRDIRPRGTLC